MSWMLPSGEKEGFMKRALLLITLILFLPASVIPQDEEILAELHEQIVRVPMHIDGFFGKKEISLTATVFRPTGDGPFPLIVLSHGNPPKASDRPKIKRYRIIPQIREFIKRGFAVIVPIRRGYGATGGDFAEDYGRCSDAHYTAAGLEAAKDIVATITFAANLPYVKSDKILLVGQSAGGFASLAAASVNPPGVIGVVNFAGGRGGRPDTNPGEPCVPNRMENTIATYAKTTKVPVLWHYAENDKYFGAENPKEWFAAFLKAGAKGRLVIQPPFGKDGHSIFTSKNGVSIWTKEFDIFIKEIGMN
ncbi:MAG: alpha/beta fold hydrolase [Deltaproteobacteria bacterium]|nr:alpha/beta fold hydrolase [Deltaproteobacteria bacterium]